MMPALACKIGTLFTPFNVFLSVIAITCVVIYFAYSPFISRVKILSTNIFLIFSSIVLFGIVALASGFIILLLFNQLDDRPPSVDYHPLNAAIKYRCLGIHPVFCPKSGEDVLSIAPKEVQTQLRDAHITYQY